MRGVVGAVLVAVCAGAPAYAADAPAALHKAPAKVTAQSSDGRWEATFNDDVRYFSWTSSRGFPANVFAANGGGSGSQLYAPAAFQLSGRPSDDLKLEFLVRSGYFWARQSSGLMSGEASGTTDTTFTASATYYGWAGLQPFGSVTVNAPTGKSVLSGSAAFARGDSDVVAIPSFGEGWNVGPTVGVNIPVSSTFVLTASVGYTNRGPFDREGQLGQDGAGFPPGPLPGGTTSLDPGDVTTFTAGFGTQVGSWTFQGSGSYSIETVTVLNDQPLYRSGPRIALSGSALQAWSESWSSKITLSFQHQSKNDVLMVPPVIMPPLAQEAFNSNSDVTKVDFGTTYKQGGLSIGPTAGFTYRNHNSWSSMDLRFLPAKTKWSAGGAAQYALTPQASINASVERLWLKENENPAPIVFGGLPAVTTDAWVASLGGVIKF